MSTADADLTPEELEQKYSPDGDLEHPVHTRDMWREAVRSWDTINGYWVWVHHQLTL